MKKHLFSLLALQVAGFCYGAAANSNPITLHQTTNGQGNLVLYYFVNGGNCYYDYNFFPHINGYMVGVHQASQGEIKDVKYITGNQAKKLHDDIANQYAQQQKLAFAKK